MSKFLSTVTAMPIPKMKMTGSVRIRRYQPPQIETEAKIVKGELKELIEEIAERIGLSQQENDPLELVNEQGLSLMTKLYDQQTYYLSGGEVKKGMENVELNVCEKMPDIPVIWAFDKRVLLHEPIENRFPETPYRLIRGLEMLQNSNRASLLLPIELLISNTSPHNIAQYIQPRLATVEEICAFHDYSTYKDFIETGSVLQNLKSDVYCNEKTSSDAARVSAAGVIDVGMKVLDNVSELRCEKNHENSLHKLGIIGYCLVRPPGHHCSCTTPSGFCLINNVAVASANILKNKSLNEEGNADAKRKPKIAIIDLDVHFGEGTASFVENYRHEAASPFPLQYLSIHRYDDNTFYPFCSEGRSDFNGIKNKNSICNVGVNTNGHIPKRCYEVISDDLIERVMLNKFIPCLLKFKPDLIFVSLGFDAAYGDPLGKMAVEGGFAKSMMLLKKYCIGIKEHPSDLVSPFPVGLVAVLEGGYNPESVSKGILSVAHALSFPGDDLELQNLSMNRVPKTWGDLRKRQERRARDPSSNTEREFNQSVEDDSILMEKHIEWCKKQVQL